MSFLSNIKNPKYYYPPIGITKNNNIHLTDVNNLKVLKIKKNINNRIIPKKITRNLHLNKSNSYNNIQNSNNKNDLYYQENTDSSLILNLKNRNNSKKEKISYHDSESLYESNIHLKTEINKLKKELIQTKAENQRKENELMRRDKLLQNAFDKGIDEDKVINNYLISENNNNIFLEKDIKKNNYISKFKKQYSELKNKFNEKIEEIEKMKKNLKTTKLNELIIQNSETLKEFNKLKELYNNLFEENKNNLEKIQKLSEKENELNEKNLIILQLQESLKLSSSTIIKYENEIENLKKNISQLKYQNQRLTNKLKTLYDHFNKKNYINKGEIQNVFELNEELSLHPNKNKRGINYNNTNRSYLNVSNRINLYNKGNNKRKILNLSPLTKKELDDSKDLIDKKNKNNNIIINNKVNKKTIINENENEKNNNNINQEEKEKNDKNKNLEATDNINDISQTMYILIKNFEVFKISKEEALTIIIKPILNDISNEKQIKNETLVNMFTNKICSCINCKENKNDFNSISNVITSLLNESNNELFQFIKLFLDIFDNIKIYEDNSKEEKEILKKINTSLNKYKDFFVNKYNEDYISFFDFRAMLNDKDIILDDEEIEYLIYKMKKNCISNISKNINNDILLSNKDDKNNSDKKNEEDKVKENILENNKIENEHLYSIFDLNYKTFLDFIK